MDPITSVFFGYAVGKVLDTSGGLLKRFLERPSLSKRLQEAAVAWCKGLPREVGLDRPESLFFKQPEGTEPGPAQRLVWARLQANRIPSRDVITRALEERREAVEDRGDAQKFFTLPLSEVEPHLNELAAALHRVFVTDDELFKLDAHEEGREQSALLRRVVVPGEPQAAKVEERSAIFEGPKPDAYFRGRDSELAQLEELLQSNRTVCVVATGIGGVGKTTLVAEFAATTARELYPDGVVWLDGSPEQLTAELARVSRRFGWSDQREPTPAEAVKLLAASLTGKRSLVVVDSFDPERTSTKHVPLVSGESRTLVTSRTRTLDVDLETDAARLELGVWPVEVCRAYLRERCERLANTPAADVDALAEFVGRLPLGGKLLVSVLRHRPGTSAAQMLGLLRAQPLGMLDKYARDRGVAATFRVGYDDLPERERSVLQALAVCARQTRLVVVEAVAAVDDAAEALDELHTRGFAELAEDGGWGLHDVVRMFVVEQRGREVFEAAHTGWVRAHMQEHSEATAYQAFGAGAAEARRAFERLVTNDLEQAYSIYGPLEKHLTTVGNYPEAMALSESLLEASPANSGPASKAMSRLGSFYRVLGNIPKAIDIHENSLAINRKLGRLEGRADHLGNLGLCYETLGDIPKAIDFHERSLCIEQKLGRLEGQARQLGNLGLCYKTRGDIAKAIDFHECSLGIEQKLGRLEGQANQLGNLGVCYQELWDIPKAIRFHERSLAIAEKLGRLEGQADQLGNLGACYQKLGDIPKAIDFYERSLAIDEKLGHREGQAIQLGNLGVYYEMLGDISKAIDFHERSLAIAEKLGRLEGQANTLGNLGFIAAEHGTSEQARGYLSRALGLFLRMGLSEEHPDVAMAAQALAKLG